MNFMNIFIKGKMLCVINVRSYTMMTFVLSRMRDFPSEAVGSYASGG